MDGRSVRAVCGRCTPCATRSDARRFAARRAARVSRLGAGSGVPVLHLRGSHTPRAPGGRKRTRPRLYRTVFARLAEDAVRGCAKGGQLVPFGRRGRREYLLHLRGFHTPRAPGARKRTRQRLSISPGTQRRARGEERVRACTWTSPNSVLNFFHQNQDKVHPNFIAKNV